MYLDLIDKINFLDDEFIDNYNPEYLQDLIEKESDYYSFYDNCFYVDFGADSSSS